MSQSGKSINEGDKSSSASGHDDARIDIAADNAGVGGKDCNADGAVENADNIGTNGDSKSHKTHSLVLLSAEALYDTGEKKVHTDTIAPDNYAAINVALGGGGGETHVDIPPSATATAAAAAAAPSRSARLSRHKSQQEERASSTSTTRERNVIFEATINFCNQLRNMAKCHSKSTPPTQLSPLHASAEAPSLSQLLPATPSSNPFRCGASRQPTNITWINVKFSVVEGILRKYRRTRHILHGVSGCAKSGQMLAIMGTSGAGKTTLLNVLAGRLHKGDLSGETFVNGQKRQQVNWRHMIGYVKQSDILYGALTVRETITFAALLRLPREMSPEDKTARVESVIESLGLSSVADSLIGVFGRQGLTIEERKRVAIGVEIVTCPRFLFLDEPTSGLDSANAFKLVKTIHNLTVASGMTTIMTIHQPRPNCMNLFTKLMLLAQGKTVFFGPLESALSHFTRIGYPCPSMENPADFFLDLMDVDLRTSAGLIETQRRLNHLHASWSVIEKDRIIPVLETYASANVMSSQLQPLPASNEAVGNGDGREASLVPAHKWPAPFKQQLGHLLRRNYLITKRDIYPIIGSFVQTIVVVLLMGFIFFRMPTNMHGVQNRIGLMFFVSINNTFSTVLPMLVVLGNDRPVIARERASGAYRMSAAFLAKLISLLPLRTVLCFIFSVILYYMTGLRTDGFGHFMLFLALLMAHMLASIGLGILISALIPMIEVSQIVAPLVIVVFIVFSGDLANSATITWILRWIQYLSVVFYCYQGLVRNEFSGQTFDQDAGMSGDIILKQYGLTQVPVVGCIGALAGLGVAYLTLAYFVLRHATKSRERLLGGSAQAPAPNWSERDSAAVGAA